MIKSNLKIYNFTSCFYGCETWSVTLKEKHKQMEFENRVLRTLLGPQRDEVRGSLEKTE
jgi:hypothetical protein